MAKVILVDEMPIARSAPQPKASNNQQQAIMAGSGELSPSSPNPNNNKMSISDDVSNLDDTRGGNTKSM